MGAAGWPEVGHAHCFLWKGSGAELADNKRVHERRDPAGELPPFVLADWLLRDRRHVVHVARSPEDGADWLGDVLTNHAHSIRGAYGVNIPDAAASARDQLARGIDVGVGRWLSGGRYLSAAVVLARACRSTHAH